MRSWARASEEAKENVRAHKRARYKDKDVAEAVQARNNKWYLKERDKLLQDRKGWYLKNREKHNAYGKERHRKDRQMCLDHYGRACSCCGIDIENFLTLDHINDDGAAHRKSGAVNLYRWAVKNHFPPILRTQCYNCNISRARYKVCPHELREVPMQHD